MCVGERFACSVAFYFIDVGVLIRPGDAQKYVSRRSFELFSFVTLYLFRVRVASFLYCVIFSCTNRRKNVLQNKHLQCTILFMVFFNSSFQIWSTAAAYGGPYGELCGFFFNQSKKGKCFE